MTIDAMGCQNAIAAQIIQRESDDALLVKNNQPGLAATIEGAFDAAERIGYQGVSHTRAGAKTLLRVDCTRECYGESSTDRRCYLVFAAGRCRLTGVSCPRAVGRGEQPALVTRRRLW